MQNVKILVVYHKRSPLIHSGEFFPVAAGKAVAAEEERAWLEQNTVGDDTGDNISVKNPSYNEMTAVYWAWKNLDAEYYGLCHYRRFFIFKPTDKIYDSVKRIDGGFFGKIGYEEGEVASLMQTCDFIAPKAMKRKSVYDHYASAHDAGDLDAAEKIIAEKYPDYLDAYTRYIHGTDAYFYNMFVFDKETFERYCTFVFGVLKDLEPRFEGKRMFVSERLTGAFIRKLLDEGKKGLFLATVCADERPTFRQACAATKKNLASRHGGGPRSLLYAFKPLLLWLLPPFVFRAYRNRK